MKKERNREKKEGNEESLGRKWMKKGDNIWERERGRGMEIRKEDR